MKLNNWSKVWMYRNSNKYDIESYVEKHAGELVIGSNNLDKEYYTPFVLEDFDETGFIGFDLQNEECSFDYVMSASDLCFIDDRKLVPLKTVKDFEKVGLIVGKTVSIYIDHSDIEYIGFVSRMDISNEDVKSVTIGDRTYTPKDLYNSNVYIQNLNGDHIFCKKLQINGVDVNE